MDGLSPLAQFLRARRSILEPQQVGLARSRSPRRVPGLRREEVAMLAGISADYYLRLEQGRELHPSTAVLDGLVDALALDAEAADHLHRIARPVSRTVADTVDRPESVSPSLIGLIASMPSVPAYVVNRYLTILHVNRLAGLLDPGLAVGGNLVKLVFDPDVPRDAAFRLAAPRAVAYLRASIDPHDEGSVMSGLLDELRALAPEFQPLWERHETRLPAGHPVTFDHPAVGSVELRYQTFELPGTGGQALGMFVPTPGNPSGEKLQRLSLLVESDRAAPRNSEGTTIAWRRL